MYRLRFVPQPVIARSVAVGVAMVSTEPGAQRVATDLPVLITPNVKRAPFKVGNVTLHPDGIIPPATIFGVMMRPPTVAPPVAEEAPLVPVVPPAAIPEILAGNHNFSVVRLVDGVWSAETTVFTLGFGRVSACQQLADGSILALAFDLYVAHSTDRGVTWSVDATQIAASPKFASQTFVNALGYDGANTVCVCVHDNALDVAKIFTSTSNGANGSFVETLSVALGIGLTGNFRGVVFVAGVFLAILEAGQVYTSPDGASWTLQTSLTSPNSYCVAVDGSNKFAAARGTGAQRVYLSSDGATWSTIDPGIVGAANFYNLTFLNGVYVAVVVGHAAREIWRSSDGAVTWTLSLALAVGEFDMFVTAVGGRFMVGINSNDGSQSWTTTSLDALVWDARIAVQGSDGNVNYLELGLTAVSP